MRKVVTVAALLAWASIFASARILQPLAQQQEHAVGASSLASSSAATAADILGQGPVTVKASNQRLIDAYGREVIFHGANVVVKGPPYIPTRGNWSWDDSFVAEDMRVMRDLGLNAIRLGTMWPGAEPERGLYNVSYIQDLAAIVQEAAGYNIRCLLDMHQDVLADKFCGEGIPNWAAVANTTNFPWPLQNTPFNTSGPNHNINPPSQCGKFNWAEYYPTQAVGQAFQNLYSNAYGLQSSWGAFWVQVASIMKGLGGAVLGYELINEPWAGDAWHDPLLMVPGVADKQNLQPAYDAIATEIRLVDPDHAIFFEGVTWDWFNVGFDHVPGGEAFANRSILSYHFYIPPDFSLDVQFAARAKDMERLGCGAMLTEYGVQACSGCGTIEERAIMEKCDSMFQSWLFWSFKPFAGHRTGSGSSSPIFHANGTVKHEQAYNMSRTYAQAIAGTGVFMNYDYATANFTLMYTVEAAGQVTKPVTEIFASEKYHYTRGRLVNVLPTSLVNSGAVSFNTSTEDPNIVLVTHDPARVPAGTLITVSIMNQP